MTGLLLGGRTFPVGRPLVMAIINRTPDSFYDKGATYEERAALDRVHRVIAEGAEIIDIGGVKAGPGREVGAVEEIARTIDFVAAVRAAYPQIVISVDTWRHEVGELACQAGADLLNDAWGGTDPALAEVAGRYGVGLVCTHAGRLPPRSRPHRISYDDVLADVLDLTSQLAVRAERAGVHRDSILIDPGHDFGKNTWHSLELTRRLGAMVSTDRPVLVALSNKDFIGETLDRPVTDRLIGSLAATAICAWHGAWVFRAHDVAATKQVLDMVASIKGDRPPARTVRGLA